MSPGCRCRGPLDGRTGMCAAQDITGSESERRAAWGAWPRVPPGSVPRTGSRAGEPVTMPLEAGACGRGPGGSSLASVPGTGPSLDTVASANGGGPQCQSAHPTADRRRRTPSVLRLVHTADVHLGARHTDLGDQATAQRERQFGAFRATVDLALAEKVDLFLIAGDLFDSNTQPRRSVERVAAELKRLADAPIRTVIIPGTHDVYDRASIYRANDLTAIAGLAPGGRAHHGPDPGRAGDRPARARRGRLRPGVRHEARPDEPAGRLRARRPAAGPGGSG